MERTGNCLIAEISWLSLYCFYYVYQVIRKAREVFPPVSRLWVKADAGTVVSGGKVTAWNDQPPGVRHLTTTSAAYQPQLVASGAAYNFNPFLNFNGQFFRYTGNILPANSGASIFSVASQTGGMGYNSLWDFYSNDPTLNTQEAAGYSGIAGPLYHNSSRC